MLVGRERELGVLEALASRVLARQGEALLVRGDPGAGKTTLLDALAADGARGVGPAGMTVLRARGVESEAELGFSALADLLAPVTSAVGDLPAPQAAALAAALALGPPARGDRLAVCVATVGLLRVAARRRPVLALVDDLHWLDAPSLECVLYAARRARAGVGVVLATRDNGAGDLATLELGPLDSAASVALLTATAPDLAPAVTAALAAAADGNPLALVELPATLSAGQRTGAAPLDLPLAPGERLQAAFSRRIGALSPAARGALLVAASYAGDDLATLAAAHADMDGLAAAESRGLVRLGEGRVAFAHPLVRGAARRHASAAERRAAHRALALAVCGEQRAWHLAAATVQPDEPVAVELEQVGVATAERRGFGSASAAFERAARLSPVAADAARRLLAAGQAAGAAGDPKRAVALLAQAAGSAGDRELRARAEHLRGRIMAWTGHPGAAVTLLEAEAKRAEDHDPVLAATMLADAANGCTHANAYVRAEGLARRAVALLGADAPDTAARAQILTLHGWVLVLRGDAVRGRTVLAEATRLAAPLDPLGPHWPWLHLLLRARIPLGELERARRESAALCARARDAGALATLGGALLVAADAAFRLGDWDVAEAETREAIRVAHDTGQPAWEGFALSTRARLLAARGRADECRAAADAAQAIADSEGLSSGLRFVHAARGFLELSLDRAEPATEELEAIEPLVAGSGLEEPTLVPWAPDLVEAHVRAGRTAEANRVLALLERQAASSGAASARAAAARCRGMLDVDFEPAFARALAFDDERPMPFERARTLLALGRRLHRARRRADARERLHEAKSRFERLGAAAWAAQTEHELRAAGGRRRPSSDRALTPQELRVAAAVRRGASNREIAAELFLSPKTIEFHLRQIYRKLGVGSRPQLVATLADGEWAAGADPAPPSSPAERQSEN